MSQRASQEPPAPDLRGSCRAGLSSNLTVMMPKSAPGPAPVWTRTNSRVWAPPATARRRWQHVPARPEAEPRLACRVLPAANDDMAAVDPMAQCGRGAARGSPAPRMLESEGASTMGPAAPFPLRTRPGTSVSLLGLQVGIRLVPGCSLPDLMKFIIQVFFFSSLRHRQTENLKPLDSLAACTADVITIPLGGHRSIVCNLLEGPGRSACCNSRFVSLHRHRVHVVCAERSVVPCPPGRLLRDMED